MTGVDGLYAYEVVLLVAGTVLFAVLLTAFVFLVFRDKPYGKLLMFFGIPIVMMGFPGINYIQFQNGVITIAESTKNLQADPGNTRLREQLAQQVKDLGTRSTANPVALGNIARAKSALAKHTPAEASARKAFPKPAR